MCQGHTPTSRVGFFSEGSLARQGPAQQRHAMILTAKHPRSEIHSRSIPAYSEAQGTFQQQREMVA